MLSKVLATLRPAAGLYALSVALVFVVASLTALKAWIVRPIVDSFLGGSLESRTLLILSLAIAGLFCSQAVFDWLHQLVSRAAGGRLTTVLRLRLFDRLAEQSLGYFDHRPSSDLASRVVHDAATYEDSAIQTAQYLIRDLALILCLLSVLVVTDWRLAVSSLVVLALVGWVLQLSHRRNQDVGVEIQSATSALSRSLTEMVAGFEVVIGLGREGDWRQRFNETNRRHYDARMEGVRARGRANLRSATIAGLGLSAILFVTGRSLLAGSISPGGFGAFVAAIYLMQQPALNFGQRLARMSQGLGAARRLFDVLEEEPEVPVALHPRALPPGALELRAENISFAYDPTNPVLSDVSLTLTPGELVVLTGESGAGKSTLAKILARFHDPDRGVVSLGEVPLGEVSRHDLYRMVSYLPQETFLFDETLELNLRLGKPDATHEELQEALRLACLDDFVRRLPEGLATAVGERGRRLSGGQRQRVAIARAVLKASPILILDEATSALEVEREQQLLENLGQSKPVRSLMLISHRPGVALAADRVLVLREGRLVEQVAAHGVGGGAEIRQRPPVGG